MHVAELGASRQRAWRLVCMRLFAVSQIDKAEAATPQQTGEGGVTELLPSAAMQKFSLNEKQVREHCHAQSPRPFLPFN